MARARSTATDGDSWLEGMPNRYGSKTLVRQQNECTFGILNNALDRFLSLAYDRTALRIAVHYFEQSDSKIFRSPNDVDGRIQPGNE
jgi:hypothetical protein